MNKKNIHTEHCHYYGCKYGEESSCTVYLGYAPPSYPDKRDKKPTVKEFKNRRIEAEDEDYF